MEVKKEGAKKPPPPPKPTGYKSKAPVVRVMPQQNTDPGDDQLTSLRQILVSGHAPHSPNNKQASHNVPVPQKRMIKSTSAPSGLVQQSSTPLRSSSPKPKLKPKPAKRRSLGQNIIKMQDALGTGGVDEAIVNGGDLVKKNTDGDEGIKDSYADGAIGQELESSAIVELPPKTKSHKPSVVGLEPSTDTCDNLTASWQDPVKPPRVKKTRKRYSKSATEEKSTDNKQECSESSANEICDDQTTPAVQQARQRLSDLRRSPSYEAALGESHSDVDGKESDLATRVSDSVEVSNSMSGISDRIAPQEDNISSQTLDVLDNEDILLETRDSIATKKSPPTRPKPPNKVTPVKNSSKPTRKAPPTPSKHVKDVNVSLDVIVPSLYEDKDSVCKDEPPVKDTDTEEGYLEPVPPEEAGGEYSYVAYRFDNDPEKAQSHTKVAEEEQEDKDRKRKSSFKRLSDVFSSKSKRKSRPSSSVFYFEIDHSNTDDSADNLDAGNAPEISESPQQTSSSKSFTHHSRTASPPKIIHRPVHKSPPPDAGTPPTTSPQDSSQESLGKQRPPAPLPPEAESGEDAEENHVYTMPREPADMGFTSTLKKDDGSFSDPVPPPRRRRKSQLPTSSKGGDSEDEGEEEEGDYIIPGGLRDHRFANKTDVKDKTNEGSSSVNNNPCLPASSSSLVTIPTASVPINNTVHHYDDVPSDDSDSQEVSSSPVVRLRRDRERHSSGSSDASDYIYPDVHGAPPHTLKREPQRDSNLSDSIVTADLTHRESVDSSSSDFSRPFSWAGHRITKDYVSMNSTASEGNIYSNCAVGDRMLIEQSGSSCPTFLDASISNQSDAASDHYAKVMTSNEAKAVMDSEAVNGADNTADHMSDDEEQKKPADKQQRAQKVFNVAQEIMTSERSFVQILRLLNVEFRKVIDYNNKKAESAIVPAASLDQILKYLPQLQVFNEDLLKDLQMRILSWEQNPRVADIFVKKGAFLKMYTDYIREFETMCSTLDETRKKYPDFDAAVTSFEKGPKCNKLALKHYMLKPIQRIPQYRLLLSEYMKHLPEDSPDLSDTQTALAIVSEVADHANQSMKYGDNLNKLLEIQNNLIGDYEVIKPGRLNDVLLYTTPVAAGYRLNHAFPLHNMKVARPTKEDFQNEFSIITTQRSFTISARTEEEKVSWLQILENTISENLRKRQSYTSKKLIEPAAVNIAIQSSDFKLGTKAPVWIPDARVSMCMICTSEFSVTFRRHHCRACGKVVCGSCSDCRAPLRYLTYKPARVCSECFHKLSKDLEEQEDLGTEPPSPGDMLSVAGGGSSPFSKASLLSRFKGMGLGSFGKGVNKKRPSVLQEVSANAEDAEMSGYLKVWKNKRWKKLWFVLKGKVLYTYKASEDAAADDSTVLLGYEVRPFLSWFQGVESSLVFEVMHKGTSSIIFRTESPLSRDKWMMAMRNATMA